MKNKSTDELLKFIDASPTPYHAVENIAKLLIAHKAIELKEDAEWHCQPGKLYYIIRNQASIIAFRLPKKFNKADTAFNMVAAHTDSPCLKLKPQTSKKCANYLQWGVEIYGGVLLNSWLDRDLHLSGRVSFEHKGKLHHKLISITNRQFRVPQLAIHLDRSANDGLKLNPETQMMPVLGLDQEKESVENLLIKSIGLKGLQFSSIKGTDLMFHDSQPASYGGINDEFIYAPRIDNLAMSHAAVSSLLISEPENKISLVALFDHEEVGSESAHGACSNFLNVSLERIMANLNASREDFLKMMPKSFLISADMAHALHPNFQDRHDDTHRPLLNGGPVIKSNAKMRYATDSISSSRFALLCDQAGISYQRFACRNDIPCGSTVGPLVSTRLGVSTLDVGNPMLSMHSAREMAGADDHAKMIAVFNQLFNE